MHEYLLEYLCCPACHGELTWTIKKTNEDHIEEGASECGTCNAIYPIAEGIGVFLTDNHEREDLWLEVESDLMRSIREDSDLRIGLMESPIETLNPADQFYRSMVLEEQGDFAGAEMAEKMAHKGLYTQSYSECWKEQVDFLIGQIRESTDPIFDIASGRGYLVRTLAQSLEVPIVASDFSLQVMRRNRRYFEYIGLYRRVSLLVFDARQTPFRAASIRTMTSNLGLPNIRGAGKLHSELRRVIAGQFLGVSHFFTPGDANATTIEQYGLADMLYEKRLVDGFTRAGFIVDIVNRCRCKARPTPTGEVAKGAQVDGLPVAEADLDWCVVRAY